MTTDAERATCSDDPWYGPSLDASLSGGVRLALRGLPISIEYPVGLSVYFHYHAAILGAR